MARRPPGKLDLTFAALGYLATFLSCLLGTAAVFAVIGTWIAVDLIYGIWTGTFRERLRRTRW